MARTLHQAQVGDLLSVTDTRSGETRLTWVAELFTIKARPAFNASSTLLLRSDEDYWYYADTGFQEQHGHTRIELLD